MSERALINLLEAQVHESDSTLFEVGEQRERNHRYYTLQKLGNEQDGRSHYISPDVFDVVETKKAHFDEVFNTGRQAVVILPGETGTQEEADQKTAYVNLTLRRNRWNRLARDAWHDAFVAKRAVFLPEWEEDTREQVVNVQGVTALDLQQLMQQDTNILDVEVVDGESQTLPGMQAPVEVFSGSLRLIRNSGFVRIHLIQPERYYRDPNCAYPEDAMYAGFSEEVSRAELINRGYDPEQVNQLKLDYRFRRDEEDSSRKAHDSSWNRRRMHKRSTETQTVTVYKTWAWVDISDYGEAGGGVDDRFVNPEGLILAEIHWSQGEILRWANGEQALREAPKVPFIEWTEYKISHAEHGLATSDPVAHTQRTNSVLKRLIVDNQQMRNTTRWEAVSGLLKNPRELLDNTIGGVVWVRRPGSVSALDTPELSPHALSIVEMLDQDKEERSGVSRLAQGMNTDVVRYQNASDMIERLTNAANKRLMFSCRSFANEAIGELSLAICEIAAQHDQRSYVVEIAGKQVQTSPTAWQSPTEDYEVVPALTPDEGRLRAQSLMTLDAQMSMKAQTNPLWAMIYGPEQQHALYDDVFDALGIRDTRRYMAQPDSQEVQQAAMQMQQQAAALRQKQEQIEGLQVQLMLSAEQRAQAELKLKALEAQTEVADTAADNDREDRKLDLDERKFVHEVKTDDRELDIAEKRGSNNPERITSVAGG